MIVADSSVRTYDRSVDAQVPFGPEYRAGQYSAGRGTDRRVLVPLVPHHRRPFRIRSILLRNQRHVHNSGKIIGTLENYYS